MKKILQCTIAQARGGRTLYVLNNWKHIDRERFHFDFVTFSPHLDFAEELETDGCKIHYMSCYPENNAELFREEFSRVLLNGYDAIHIHTGMWKGMAVEKLARAFGIRQIIIHAHNTGMGNALSCCEEENGRRLHFEIRKNLKESDATHFLACSQKAAQWLYGDRISREKILILKNAIEAEKFGFSDEIRNKVRNDLNLSKCYIIGHVGRFVYQKNHEFLLQVFCNVSRLIPDARLVLVGEGELRQYFEKKIVDLGLEKKVLLLGKREDVHEILQAFDLFVFPSLFEGFGTAVIEAQSAGLPCIVSDAVPEETGITNLIKFLPLDLKKWEELIIEEYYKRQERHSYYTEIAKAGYDINKQIKLLETVYS